MRSPVILGPNGLPALVGADRLKIDKQSRFNPLRNWTPDVLTRQLEGFAKGDHDDQIALVAPKAKAAVSRHGFDVVIKEEIPEAQRGMAEDQQGSRVVPNYSARISSSTAGAPNGERRSERKVSTWVSSRSPA